MIWLVLRDLTLAKILYIQNNNTYVFDEVVIANSNDDEISHQTFFNPLVTDTVAVSKKYVSGL